MTIEFQVEGMSCQHCVAAVTNAIREQDAAAQVKIDLATGRVAVDSTQSAEALKAAIDEAGYTVVGRLTEAGSRMFKVAVIGASGCSAAPSSTNWRNKRTGSSSRPRSGAPARTWSRSTSAMRRQSGSLSSAKRRMRS